MNIKKIDFEYEADWLEFRKGFISSTEAAPLLNAGKWCTYFKLWHLKNGTLEDDFKETQDIFWGKLLEKTIGEGFSILQKCEVVPYKTYHYRDDIKVGSSYDFLITSGQYEGYILETKKMRSLAMKTWSEEVPLQYQIQANQQMNLMPEAKGVVVAALVDGGELKHWVIERNEKIINLINKRAVAFWESIEKGEEPPIDLEDPETVKKLNQATTGEIIDSNYEIEALCEELKEVTAIAKEKEDRKKKIVAQLLSLTEAAKVNLSTGQTLDLGITKASEGKLITADMVGQSIGARSAFRRCQLRGKAKA